MNYLYLLISSCKLILVLLDVNLITWFMWINYVSIHMFYILT